jgi:lipopolysaccharide export system permease protein
MIIHFYGILARHVVRQILIPFCCCFLGFLFLFFIADLQDELSDMLGHKNYFNILIYFLYKLPEKIPLILPMSLLLGTMYSFSNLNRHNEISAIRSSGISLTQLSVPVFILALLASGFLFISNEYFEKYFNQEASRLYQEITNETPDNESVAFAVNTTEGTRLWNFTLADEKYSKISLSQNDIEGNPLWTIDAANGQYTAGEGWSFQNLIKTTYDKNWFPSPPLKLSNKTLNDIDDDPVKMRRYHNFSQHLSLNEINERLESNVQFSPFEQQIMKVKYYSLIFSPFACMISILLGIPLSITQQRQGALTSSAKALGIMIAYYVVSQVFQNMGNAGHLPAFIAGSLPTISFISFGLYISLRK